MDISPEDYAAAAQSPAEAPEFFMAVTRLKRDAEAQEALFAPTNLAVSRL